MSRALCPPAATHLGCSSSKRLFDPEAALRPLLKLTSTHTRSTAGFGHFGCRWWLQKLGGERQRDQLFDTLAIIELIAAVVAGALWLIIDEAEMRFRDLGGCGRHMLTAHDPSIVQRLMCATTGSVQDAWRRDPYPRNDSHTNMCGSGSGAAHGTIAVDHEAAYALCRGGRSEKS